MKRFVFVLAIFEQNNIGAVIRLNDRLYKEEVFEKEGVHVYDLEFPDGSCPNEDVITRFITIVEQQVKLHKAVAVHCRAGLGRTGTLIGCYIMNRHPQFKDVKSLIAWMRICRPGMVVGDQQ